MVHEPSAAAETGNGTHKKKLVEVWEKRAGVIEIVECPWGLLKIRNDIPEGLDPVQVIINYLKVVDIEGTKLLQRMRNPQKPASDANHKKGDRRPNLPEPGPSMGKYHAMRIYKDRVIDLYRKLPETFSSAEIFEYFQNCYSPITCSPETARNKVYAYTNFLIDNAMLKKVGRENKTFIYRFTAPPFGAVKPAQAEFDSEYMKKQKALELEAMRRTV